MWNVDWIPDAGYNQIPQTNRPLAILLKSLDRALFPGRYISLVISIHFYTRGSALELVSLSCTFENSTECSILSFDSDSFQNS